MSLMLVADPIPLRTDADGIVRVGKTRVTLDTVVGSFKDGATAEEIVHRYPSVRLAEVYSVIAYYLEHQTEVDAYLSEGERQAAEVRKENEARFDPNGVRDRLLARRAARSR